MKICENCGQLHDGTYGSGRFCSQKCSKSFSTKNKRKEINEKVSKKLKGQEPWNKGKTNVYSEESLKKMGEKQKGRPLSKSHKQNIGKSKKGVIFSDSHKNKISKAIQERVKNGLHKGWITRNNPSYAEKFFKEVLQNNNLIDKCTFEFKISKKELGLNEVGNYYLDILFFDKKIDLEIDGKQHWLDKDRVESDKLRDQLLTQNGYKVYRIKWKNINTEQGKRYISEEIDKFLKFYDWV